MENLCLRVPFAFPFFCYRNLLLSRPKLSNVCIVILQLWGSKRGLKLGSANCKPVCQKAEAAADFAWLIHGFISYRCIVPINLLFCFDVMARDGHQFELLYRDDKEAIRVNCLQSFQTAHA